MEKERNTDLFRPLATWLVLTITYGIALYTLRNFEVLSLIYHIGLLLLAILYAKGLDGLGIRVGQFRDGALLCSAFLGFSIVRSILWHTSKFALSLDIGTFSLLFFAPIAEELFWRGFILQRMLKHPKMNKEQAVIGNAGLFALMHIPKLLIINEGATSLIYVLVLGIIFALIYYLTESVYYSTLIHIINNIFV